MSDKLEVIDTTVQKTHEWLGTITEELGWGDKQLAYHGLRATLHALRDRIPVEEAAEFGAQLPLLIRGLYYEAWKPARTPHKERSKDEFLAHIRDIYDYRENVDIEALARAVFATANRFMTEGQTSKTRMTLNEELRELWPEPAA